MTTPIVEHVPARAALAGNPSDGYQGAVFAVPVDAYGATASLEPLDSGYEFVDARSGTARFERWIDLERAITSLHSDGPHCLQLGAAANAAGRSGALRPFRLRIDTTIPVSVGLAGSSAIVIASLRALLRWSADAMDDDELAVAALAVETLRLGIDAGLQDRVVQVHGRPMLMDFRANATQHGLGAFTPKQPGAPFQLLVATRAGSSEPSQVVHGDLRARIEFDPGATAPAMAELAAQAMAAADAYEVGDSAALGATMDATFDIRASLLDLSLRHVEMIEAARSSGAHANYTGSGGSIVALCATEAIESATRQSLNSLDCSVVSIGTDEHSGDDRSAG